MKNGRRAIQPAPRVRAKTTKPHRASTAAVPILRHQPKAGAAPLAKRVRSA